MCENAYYFVLVMNWSCEQLCFDIFCFNISSQCLSIIQPAFLPIFELSASKKNSLALLKVSVFGPK